VEKSEDGTTNIYDVNVNDGISTNLEDDNAIQDGDSYIQIEFSQELGLVTLPGFSFTVQVLVDLEIYNNLDGGLINGSSIILDLGDDLVGEEEININFGINYHQEIDEEQGVINGAQLCNRRAKPTETTTEEPTTTTTEEVCPCTDDVTGQIFNGFTPFFAKFGQIKGYASGANTFVFAMAQTIHDAEKNPGMPAGGHDGYIVIRKYNSCDHTVMEKFADPSVTWEMTDFTCGDCYTSHQGGYFKNDVANKKKTFTLGYSFNNDGTDTNKASQVDKYLLMVSGLQALGVTEQQAFDCLAGAKPANMYGEFMEEGCDYSHCVGEKVLIW